MISSLTGRDRAALALVDPTREKGVTFLKPRLVAQISYQELTVEKSYGNPFFWDFVMTSGRRKSFCPRLQHDSLP